MVGAKHGHSANSGLFQGGGGSGGGGQWGGLDERQEDARCIRGVNQATCRWASPWWYGMAPSSSGAILSMSARFSRLDAQQQQHTTQRNTTQHTAVRPGKEKKPPVCRVRFSTDPFLCFALLFIYFFIGWKML